jgi:peptidoglycan/xylan/chitin deacetylase (PgdA/CDA1 family)
MATAHRTDRRLGTRQPVAPALVVAVLLVGLTAWAGGAPVGSTTSAAAPRDAVAPVFAAAPSAGRPIVVRGSTWYVRDALTGGSATATFNFGASGDTPLSGDWDGNGTNTPGVVRGRTWSLRNSDTTGGADITFSYGTPGDVPIVGDWDGNGTFTPGVVRGNVWHLRNRNSSGAADTTLTYGRRSDLVIAGDWDGNGTFTPGVVRGNAWYLRNSNSTGGANVLFAYGRATDRPVVGDWDGNGTSTPGVVRNRYWYLRNANSGGAATISFAYGRPCDIAMSTESALVRDRGGRSLRSSLAGVHLTTLPTSAKVVALTFDAGANADGVPSILATLESKCVPATFFLTGDWVRNFPQNARTIGLRYPVGNHTNTHPHLTTLSDAAVRSEIVQGQSAIQSATKYDPRPMFRFPFGESNASTLSIANGLRYASVRWTVDTLGWQGTSGGRSVSSVVSRVLSTLRPGQIVLMHVGSHPTDRSTLDADALPRIIDELRARGYTFVTVNQYM